jgi:hypothetical protein
LKFAEAERFGDPTSMLMGVQAVVIESTRLSAEV